MTTNEMLDAIIRANPTEAGVFLSRDQVINHWCEQRDKDKNHLTIDDILAIRALPEWQHAG